MGLRRDDSGRVVLWYTHHRTLTTENDIGPSDEAMMHVLRQRPLSLLPEQWRTIVPAYSTCIYSPNV